MMRKLKSRLYTRTALCCQEQLPGRPPDTEPVMDAQDQESHRGSSINKISKKAR